MRTSISFLPFSFQSDPLILTASTLSGAFPSVPPEGLLPSRSALPLLFLASASLLQHRENQFCIKIKRRKSHLPDLPRNCVALGLLSLFLPCSFTFSSSFSDTNRLTKCSLRLVHQRLFLCFTCFLFFFLFHFFSFHFFTTRHVLTGASKVLGSFLRLCI